MSRVTRVARLDINTLNTGQRLRDTRNNNVGIIIAIIGIQWDTGKTDLWSNTNKRESCWYGYQRRLTALNG